MENQIKNLALLFLNKQIDKDMIILQCHFDNFLIEQVIKEIKYLKNNSLMESIPIIKF